MLCEPVNQKTAPTTTMRKTIFVVVGVVVVEEKRKKTLGGPVVFGPETTTLISESFTTVCHSVRPRTRRLTDDSLNHHRRSKSPENKFNFQLGVSRSKRLTSKNIK